MCVNIFFADMYTYFSKINDGSEVKWKPRGQDGLKSFEFFSLLFSAQSYSRNSKGV